MERVTGIGGVFFRGEDPAALAAWYATHLGVLPPPESYEQSSWWQQAGPTVFTAMSGDAEHFKGRQWSINFRVSDLDAMVSQLEDAGIAVEVDADVYPNGRFAALLDPEGNPIQLWQPAGSDAAGP